MSLFNSFLEFYASGVVQSPESLVIETLAESTARDSLHLRSAGGIMLSANQASGALWYDSTDECWKITNGSTGAAPLVSGINGVGGPEITFEGGGNITIVPDPANNKIILSAGDVSGIQTVNGADGPAITVDGAGGIAVTTIGDTISISHGVGAYIVGYSGFRSGTNALHTITHNLGTSFIVPRFIARSGPASVQGRYFEPRIVKVASPNTIDVRTDHPLDYDVVILGMVG